MVDSLCLAAGWVLYYACGIIMTYALYVGGLLPGMLIGWALARPVVMILNMILGKPPDKNATGNQNGGSADGESRIGPSVE